VGIGFIDFQGLWKGRKTAPSFSGLSINRHFHGVRGGAKIDHKSARERRLVAE
jgi:hypothetical protein